MDYREALEALFALRRFGMRPGLESTRRLLDKLGRPDAGLRVVHVGGTNGKGSTAAFVEAMARAAGLKTGLYTSPHLSRFTERVRVDGEEIAEAEVAALAAEVLAASDVGAATFFEIVTAMALLAFQRRGVEVAVIEVGLGGRYDATNAIAETAVSVITSVGRDHLDVLGPTLADVARDKAGIFRRGVPAVVAAGEAELAVLGEVAAGVGAPLYRLGHEIRVSVGEELHYEGPGGALAAPELALAGAHQCNNAALALAALALAGLPVGDDARMAGLAQARWPGRLERMGDLVFDGAHNPDGALALAAAIGAARPTLVFGALADKDAVGTLLPLLPLVSRVILTRPESSRALDPAELLEQLRTQVPTEVAIEVIDAPAEALARARSYGATTLVAGSLFLVGALRRRVTGERADPLVVQDPVGQKR